MRLKAVGGNVGSALGKHSGGFVRIALRGQNAVTGKHRTPDAGEAGVAYFPIKRDIRSWVKQLDFRIAPAQRIKAALVIREKTAGFDRTNAGNADAKAKWALTNHRRQRMPINFSLTKTNLLPANIVRGIILAFYLIGRRCVAAAAHNRV